MKKKSLDRPEVEAMAKFYVDPANAKLVDEVGYVSLPASIAPKVNARIADRKVGSVFEGRDSQQGESGRFAVGKSECIPCG